MLSKRAVLGGVFPGEEEWTSFDAPAAPPVRWYHFYRKWWPWSKFAADARVRSLQDAKIQALEQKIQQLLDTRDELNARLQLPESQARIRLQKNDELVHDISDGNRWLTARAKQLKQFIRDLGQTPPDPPPRPRRT